MVKEIEIKDPLPSGYRFVKKGHAYITRHCTTETEAAGKELLIVFDGKERAGLACPKAIHDKVVAAEKVSRTARESKRTAKLLKDLAEADAVLKKLFPKFPKKSPKHDSVLLQAWTVGTGRVGRKWTLSIEDKVRFAVQAIARHQFTNYDALLKQGKTRDEARAAIKGRVRQLMLEWAGKTDEATKKDETKVASAKLTIDKAPPKIKPTKTSDLRKKLAAWKRTGGRAKKQKQYDPDLRLR